MRIIDGTVVVRPYRENDEIILASGHKLYVPLEMKYHEGITQTRMECIVGVATHTPDKVKYDTVEDCEMQIQVGDVVIYHFLEAERKERITDDKNEIRVHYSRIFTVVRNGNIIPINGWILCQPIQKTLKSDFLHIPSVGKTEYENYAIAKYISKPTKRYLAKNADGTEHYIRDTEYPDILPGDKLYLTKNSDVLVENTYEKILGEKLFRIRRNQIMACQR